MPTSSCYLPASMLAGRLDHAVKHAASSQGGIITADHVTAVATAVLALFAIVTAVYARKAFREQSKINAKQTPVLELQATELRESIDERKREREERRRAQASQVFVTAEAYPREGEPISSIKVSVKNTSQQPIYDLILLWPGEAGEWIDLGDPVYLPVLMPDEQHKWGAGIEPSVPVQSFLTDPHLIRAAIIFRDAVGAHWRLDSDGHLDQAPEAG